MIHFCIRRVVTLEMVSMLWCCSAPRTCSRTIQSLAISDFHVMPCYTLLSVKSSSQDLNSIEHFYTELSRVEIWLWTSSIYFCISKARSLVTESFGEKFSFKANNSFSRFLMRWSESGDSLSSFGSYSRPNFWSNFLIS